MGGVAKSGSIPWRQQQQSQEYLIMPRLCLAELKLAPEFLAWEFELPPGTIKGMCPSQM